MSQNSELVIRVFGPQAQLVNDSVLHLGNLALPVTAETLLTRIGQTYPVLEDSVRQSRLAVNHQFASESDVISGGEELALIGLVSGG